MEKLGLSCDNKFRDIFDISCKNQFLSWPLSVTNSQSHDRFQDKRSLF